MRTNMNNESALDFSLSAMFLDFFIVRGLLLFQ
jgi:hypothetical protein